MADDRRYYSLDALRGAMMMLGIVLHGSQWYVSQPLGGIALPTDSATAYVFDLIVYFIHSFRMPLFFVLAGFFTSLLVERRGLKGTWSNRVQRILNPLLVSCVTILPLTMLFGLGFLVSARFDTHQLLPTLAQLDVVAAELAEAGLPTDQPSLGHLWFLYYLLYFYLIIPLCQLLVDRAQPFREGINRLLGSPYLLILLGLMTAASLWPFRGAVVFEGFLFIKPHLPSLIYYGLFFLCGYVFHHHRCILLTFRKYWLQNLLLAAVLFPLALYVTGLDIAQPEQSLHTVAVLLHGLCTWALIYAFMGLFLRYLDYASPWILYISQSSYWVYLIHLPVISFAAWWMLPYNLPAVAKFACIVTFTSLVCVVTYHYLVQRSWISSLLNGKRFNLDWPWRTRSAAPSRSSAGLIGDS